MSQNGVLQAKKIVFGQKYYFIIKNIEKENQSQSKSKSLLRNF
jgi:hypothetical protein